MTALGRGSVFPTLADALTCLACRCHRLVKVAASKVRRQGLQRLPARAVKTIASAGKTQVEPRAYIPPQAMPSALRRKSACVCTNSVYTLRAYSLLKGCSNRGHNLTMRRMRNGQETNDD